MADTPPAEPKAGKSQFGFLTRKVGPLPVWAWGAIAAGGYYWYTHYGPGAAKAAAAAAPPAQKPQVVVVDQQGKPVPGPAGPAGPEGPAGPQGPRGPKAKRKARPPRQRPPGKGGGGPPTVQGGTPAPVVRQGTVPLINRQPVAPVPQPVVAVAPMTAGDVYGGFPTASMDGSTYDSGYPSAAQLEGAYVPAV